MTARSKQITVIQSKAASVTNQRLVAAVLDLLPEGVAILDTQGHFTFLNATAREVLAHNPLATRSLSPEDKALELSFSNLDGLLVPAEETPIARALCGETVQDTELLLGAADGQQVPVGNAAWPVCDETGSVIGAVWLFHDLRAQEKAEDRLQGLTTALRDAWEQLAASAPAAQDSAKRERSLRRDLAELGDQLEETEEELTRTHDELEVQVTEHHADLTAPGRRLREEVVVRQRTQRSLEDTEGRFQAIFEASAMGIAIAKPSGRLIKANRVFEEMLGHSREELVGKDIMELTHPDDVQAQVEHLRELVEGTKDHYQLDQRYVKKDGGLVWGRPTVSAVRGAGGRLLCLVAMIEDVTERKQAEEARDQLVTILEATADFVSMADADGRLLYLNSAARAMTGLDEEEDISELTMVDGHPEWAQELIRREGLPAAIREGFWMGETAVLSRTGKETPVSQLIAAHKEATGTVKLLSTTARDISDRKAAEAALRASETRYRIVADNTYDWEYWLDVGGEFLYCSPSCERITGYRASEFLMDPGLLLKIVHPDDLAEFGSHCLLSLSPNHSEELELRIIRRDGVERWIDHVCQPVYDPNGHFLGTRGTNKDITSRRQAEEQREGMVMELREVNDQLLNANRHSQEQAKEAKRWARELAEEREKLQRTLEGAIQAMALTAEMRDPYTAGHQKRVARLACAIGQEMGLPQDQIYGLRMAGIVHDLGKIYVPAEILSKPGRITDMEFGLTKTHSEVGYEILQTIQFPRPIAQMVRQHHERMDGSGYPAGLAGVEILLEARILAVADVVEAMASHRPYRPALGIDRALEEIARNSGRLYDPEVAEACRRIFDGGKFMLEQNHCENSQTLSEGIRFGGSELPGKGTARPPNERRSSLEQARSLHH